MTVSVTPLTALPMARLSQVGINQARFRGADFVEQIDKPPLAIKPDIKSWAMYFGHILRHSYILRNQMNIRDYRYEGEGKLQKYLNDGYRVILVPNHPGLGDVYMMMELGYRIGHPFAMMSTTGTFTAKPHLSQPGWKQSLGQKLLAANGAFPVHNDSPSDRSAVRTSLEQLEKPSGKGGHPVTIFGEGHLTFQNDRIVPLNEGPAFIGLSAAKKLEAEGAKVAIFPVGIKHRYPGDVLPVLAQHLTRLEKHLGLTVGPYLPSQTMTQPISRIDRIWDRVLVNTTVKYALKKPAGETLAARHQDILEQLMAPAEKELNITPSPNNTVAERVKAARQKMYPLINEKEPTKQLTPQVRQRFMEDFVPRLWTAFFLQKLERDYLDGNTRSERLMETLHKLEEQVYGKSSLITASLRNSVVSVADPIVLNSYLPGFKSRDRQVKDATLTDLTRELQRRLQAQVDNIWPVP
jgi:hypothetical protein